MSVSLVFSAFFAGVLTIFSPCVLPMVPFVARASFEKSKWGPVFLALGVALSFSVSTYLISTTGQLLGLSPDNLKIMSGVFLLIASILFLFPSAIDFLSGLLAPLNSKLQNRPQKASKNKLFSEFINGLLLGPIWAPCSGPTLAIIVGLIINEPETKISILLLAIFSIGSILPILFLSYGAKALVQRVQGKFLGNSHRVKQALGIFCAVMALLILTGLDKALETYLLSILPEFITNLSLSV